MKGLVILLLLPLLLGDSTSEFGSDFSETEYNCSSDSDCWQYGNYNCCFDGICYDRDNCCHNNYDCNSNCCIKGRCESTPRCGGCSNDSVCQRTKCCRDNHCLIRNDNCCVKDLDCSSDCCINEYCERTKKCGKTCKENSHCPKSDCCKRSECVEWYYCNVLLSVMIAFACIIIIGLIIGIIAACYKNR